MRLQYQLQMKLIVAAKILKWGMFKGTLEPQSLYIFNPRLLKTQTTIAINIF